MKRIFGILSVMLFLLPCHCWGVDYYFTAEEDHLLSNPSNWSPAYPGTKIGEDDKAFILADAFFEGYTIEINGELQIWSGFTLSGQDGGLKVSSTGKILNYGSIIADKLENIGRIDNGPSAALRLADLVNMPGAFLQNGIGSTLDITRDFINKGEFQNLNECRVQSLVNYAMINLLMRSAMHVEYYNTQGKHKMLASQMSHFCSHKNGHAPDHHCGQEEASNHPK